MSNIIFKVQSLYNWSIQKNIRGCLFIEILTFIKNLITVAENKNMLGAFIFVFIILTMLLKDIKLVSKNLTKILIAYSIVISIISNILK